MINVCQKGKRVERDLVNWLKARECPSARRSAQHCGIPTNGATGEIDNSDIIVPDELPSWHIESKATKSPKTPCSTLKKWVNQIKTDCPKGKLAVILTVANGYSPVALMTSDVYKAVARAISSLTVTTEDSFAPAIELKRLDKAARVYGTLIEKAPPPFSGAVAYEIEAGAIIVAVEASLWLGWAFIYEGMLKEVKANLEKGVKDNAAPKLEIVK
jgi:hypothetical protein